MIGFWVFLEMRHSALNSSLYLSLLCLLLLAGCGVGFSIVKELRRKRGLNAFWTPTEKLIAATGNAIGKAMLVILGVLIGAGWTNYQFYANRYHYDKVLITTKSSPSDYEIQPAKMQPFKVHSCTPIRWEVGQRLKFVDLHFTPECDDLGARGAYKFEDENTNKEIAHE